MKKFNSSSLLAFVLASAGSAADTAITSSEIALEEVTVTAQKRSENDKKVPLLVSTISAENVKTFLSTGDVQALSGEVPGLYVESSNGRIAPRFYLRGLGNVDFDLAASQPVSFIYDDVVQENVILKSMPLFDIDTVEVVRGPQGTLFGRNTTAGLIKFTTKRPTANTEGFLKTSFGSYGSANVEGAIGGSLVDDTLLGRFSFLTQHRDDWIDNDYTGESDAIGGLRELAGRVQLLYTPTDTLSALLSIHHRDLDGSQTAFRANVFTTGSNDLNENYNRGSVFYDSKYHNTQEYDGTGGSLTVDVDFNGYTLTSITALEESSGFNDGDIDGGVAGVGPGFIPFSSETLDAGDVEQKSQELRFASPIGEFWDWQVGAFYFDSKLSVFTDAGFNSATVEHSDNSTAVFAQNNFNFDKVILGAGIRFTEDEKDFDSMASGVDPIHVEVSKTSWDASATYLWSDATSFYARVADGFRAPSIQGRNVAFFGAPSVAKSEDIISFEVGFKSDLIDRKLRINGAFFDYTIDNFQVSAIGGASNSNELMNAKEGKGRGFETDLEIVPSESAKITIGYSYADTKIQDRALYTAVCGSMQCTVTDPVNEQGFALIDGNPFPGAPKSSFNFTFFYKHPIASGNIFFFTDWVYQDEVNMALYESKEFVTDVQYEGGVKLGYESANGDYEFSVFSRNVTNESNVKGFVDFNNNTGFVNEPRISGVELQMTF